jgi:hypothetical protein
LKRDRSNKRGDRDLRPAVFIKDLHQRAKAIEEEKAELRKKSGKGRENNVLTEKLAKQPESHATMIKRAIAKQDLQGLTNAIYEAKIKNSGEKEVHDLILQGEEVLVQLSAKV